jgi:gliding motility-associated-like protein
MPVADQVEGQDGGDKPKEKKKKRDVHNVEGKDPVAVTYIITVTNKGSVHADSVQVRFQTQPGLNITNPSEGGVEVLWEIPGQLPPNQSRDFRVTVEPESQSEKGSKKSIASLTTSSNFAATEEEKSDNADTAYLNLFSVLDGWPIMEAFSPNGDGKNDKFLIRELRSDLVESAEIVIVNRYGAVVYTNEDYKTAQDGEDAFTGSGLPEGSYFYQLTVHFRTDGSTDKRGGVVTIRRSRWK